MNDLPGRVGAFLEEEAELLDARRWRDWFDLFLPDAWYWVPVSTDQTDPMASPSHLFEPAPVIRARVERLMEAKLIPQSPPSRTSRLIGGIRVETTAHDPPIRARCRFHLVEARVVHDADEIRRLWAGTCSYGLADTSDGLRIAWKRVDLVDSEAGLTGLSVPL
jgi:benzoate/toluate 1,2-dioxygenase beta subunit